MRRVLKLHHLMLLLLSAYQLLNSPFSIKDYNRRYSRSEAEGPANFTSRRRLSARAEDATTGANARWPRCIA